MLPYRDSRFTKILLGIFFLLVGLYAVFEGRGLLYGPTISIDNRVMEVHDPFITIEGSAERIASLTMNGQTIPVTEEGAFEEQYLLAEGYNRIVLSARDRFGKKTERVIEVVYNPAKKSTAPSPATSTPME